MICSNKQNCHINTPFNFKRYTLTPCLPSNTKALCISHHLHLSHWINLCELWERPLIVLVSNNDKAKLGQNLRYVTPNPSNEQVDTIRNNEYYLPPEQSAKEHVTACPYLIRANPKDKTHPKQYFPIADHLLEMAI